MAKRLFVPLVPFDYRLRKGLLLSDKERKTLADKLWRLRKELPLFSGKKVLCWEPAPWPFHIALSSSLGLALSLRGCQVEQFICDGTPVACIGREASINVPITDWREQCTKCYESCKKEAHSFGVNTISFKELIPENKLNELDRISKETELNKIQTYIYKGINVGIYASSSVLRYYKGYASEPDVEIVRKYFFSALVCAEAAMNVLAAYRPDVLYMTHGIYSSWGPALRASVKRQIPVVKLAAGYKKSSFYLRKILSFDNVHQGTISDAGWKERLRKPLSEKENKLLDRYINSRYTKGSGDISIAHSPSKNEDNILLKLGIDHSKPIWCIFTNVMWDASIDVAPMTFENPTEWLLETIKVAMKIDNITWLLKIHPAEKSTGTILGAEHIINNYFKELPLNIKVISADTDINTYDIYRISDGGIACFGNTPGIEMLMMGKPMIVAGESIYAKKGFTYDGLTIEQYLDYISKAASIPSLSQKQQYEARKLAYSYFIQRQIPFELFKTKADGQLKSFDWSKIDLLLPDRNPIVDMICKGFFEGDDFCLPDNVEYLSNSEQIKAVCK